MKKYKTLPASELEVGHGIIVNAFDRPCGGLVAIITSVDDDGMWCKYLDSDRNLDGLNKNRGMLVRADATPVGRFGVEVRYEFSDGDIVYWCEPVGESKAKYSTGDIRLWQEVGYRRRYVVRGPVFSQCF